MLANSSPHKTGERKMDSGELLKAADVLLARAGFGPGGSRVELRRRRQMEFEDSVIPAGIVPPPARGATVPAYYGCVGFLEEDYQKPRTQVVMKPPKSSPKPPARVMKSCRRDHRRARRPR